MRLQQVQMDLEGKCKLLSMYVRRQKKAQSNIKLRAKGAEVVLVGMGRKEDRTALSQGFILSWN